MKPDKRIQAKKRKPARASSFDEIKHVLVCKRLLVALTEMERQSQVDHPDATVQAAINQLSDAGHAYLWGAKKGARRIQGVEGVRFSTHLTCNG